LKQKDERTKYIEGLMEKRLGPDDTFWFGCKACGNCCRNRDDVLLSAYDLYRIARHLKIKPQEAFKKYCESYIGHTSNLPVVRLKPKPIPNMLLRIPQPHSSVCPLLSDDGKCSVHKSKPATCALFPLGRVYDPKEKGVFYVLNDGDCGGKKELHTVKGWLAYFNLPVHDEAYIKWNEFLTECMDLMRNKFKKLPDKVKETLWNGYFLIMYISYDINEEFLPQLERNIEQYKKLLEITKDKLRP